MPTDRPRRPATLREVAEATGLSTAAVSLALRGKEGVAEETRERVRRVADELGYRPDRHASRLRLKEQRLIGVVFDVRQAFHSLLIEGIYQSASRRGYAITLSGITDERTETDAVKALQSDRAEGLILIGSGFTADRLTDLHVSVPCVSVGGQIGPTIPCVATDEHEGTRLAIAHLAALGHTEIGVIDGGPTSNTGKRRTAAYTHRIEQLIGRAPSAVVSGGKESEDGPGAIASLLSAAPETTAVVCYNDLVAIGALLALRARGVDVPRQLSIVGFDDNRMAALEGIDLTTIRQDPLELARLATDRTIDLIEGMSPEPHDQIVTPTLVERSTTAAPRKPRGGVSLPPNPQEN